VTSTANTVYLITVWVLPVLVAVTFHEAAHAYVAHLLGDTKEAKLILWDFLVNKASKMREKWSGIDPAPVELSRVLFLSARMQRLRFQANKCRNN
jgi:hypothetical protein